VEQLPIVLVTIVPMQLLVPLSMRFAIKESLITIFPRSFVHLLVFVIEFAIAIVASTAVSFTCFTFIVG